MEFFEKLAEQARECGAYKAKVIDTNMISFDEGLRKAC